MSTDILINSRSYEVRLALVENNVLTEFHMQRPMEKGLKGNIYMGKVVRVLPGMQAAFVDIGLERTGFLYVDDVYLSAKDIEKRILVHEPAITLEESPPVLTENSSRRSQGLNIEELLSEGQDILVQVSKGSDRNQGGTAHLPYYLALPQPGLHSADRPYRYLSENRKRRDPGHSQGTDRGNSPTGYRFHRTNSR